MMATSKTGSAARPKRAAKKRYDREKAKVWGSPDYLKMRFGDIADIEEVSKRCVGHRCASDAVRHISTRRDMMQVRKVYRADLIGPGGRATGQANIVAVGVGLNGHGRQSDYLAALKRLTDTGAFSIFDCYVDAVDDLADVLCTFDPSALSKAPERKGV